MVSQEPQELYLPTEMLFMMKFKNETYILPVCKLLIIQNILIHIYKNFTQNIGISTIKLFSTTNNFYISNILIETSRINC